jgi:hypothetical protein
MQRLNRPLLAGAGAAASVLALGAAPGAHAQTDFSGGEHRALKPVSAICFAIPDARGNARCTLTTVPAGKRLVTLSVSYFATSSSPVVRAALLSPSATNLPIAAPVFNPATGTLYVTGLNLNLIVEESTPVDFFMFGTNGTVEATLNAYLIDK